MESVSLTIRGRGVSENPPNRFEQIELERDFDQLTPNDEVMSSPATRFFKDTSRTIIAENDSPDVGFRFSINPYRGCEHGCIYCYARPTHEYLSLSSGLDFESKIFVKLDAPQLLHKELQKPKWSPETISISGVTDCYQPAEARFQITRKCLEVLHDFRNPAGVITKSHLVTRDVDILSAMAKQNLCIVLLSITTLDADVSRRMEPRAASPERRLDAMRELTTAGIPCGVMVAPVVPGLTDHEMPQIIAEAARAGACTCGYVPVRLPFQIKDMFETWLEQHFADRKDKVLNRIRSMRGGKLNSSEFHDRMRGQGQFAEQLKQMFAIAKRKAGLDRPGPALSTDHFRRVSKQLALW